MVALVCLKCHGSVSKKNGTCLCSNCVSVYPIYNDIPSFTTASAEEDSFNKENFEFLFEMEQHHFWHLGRREIIYALLQKVYRNRLPYVYVNGTLVVGKIR